MSPIARHDQPPPTIARLASTVVEKNALHLLVLLVCSGMIWVGIYTYRTVIMPMQQANIDARDGMHERTQALEKVAATLERATENSKTTAVIQQETTRQLVELTREIARAREK